jgi:predicted lipoprotein with Yx(FWY)xxD motif
MAQGRARAAAVVPLAALAAPIRPLTCTPRALPRHSTMAQGRPRAVSVALLAALAALAAPILLLSTPASALYCTPVPQADSCFNDTVAHPLGVLVDEFDANMTVESCTLACAANGYPLLAATGHTAPSPQGFCYCGAAVDPAAQAVPASNCDVPCPGNSSQTCGGNGFSSLYAMQCNGPLPPAPVGPPLPPGPACSQPQAQAWPFCNTSLPLEARVADLVGRISLVEAGAQLTSRESPAIPRLGINRSFYWGMNSIHGLMNNVACVPNCPTSWPDGIALAASWNESMWQVMGAVSGVEARALSNTVWAADSLTLWGPTINLVRDGR